eukprot:TRINITY_DN7921_c0_g1_i11.p1 TRINITY_DN7921_c0_g1~~TRINITY_DN7921_c0_g1_i11.p1  ORF type:complete len:503 (+),score=111.55 TRINITY_DN7921_c0_g1_i11:67-1509(+)
MAAKASSAALLLFAGADADTAFISGTPALRKAVSGTSVAAGASQYQPATSSSSSMASTAALTFLGAAAAAAVAGRRRTSTNTKKVTAVAAFENELGVQAPVGFWDPAGFTANGDAAEFFRRRVVELKHGRVSMLACTGYIVQEFVRFPGYVTPSDKVAFADVPNGLAALNKLPSVGLFQYVFFCGLCDLWLMHQRPDNPPGQLVTRLFGDVATNYGYGAFGIPAYLGGKPIADPEIKKKKLSAELANGRLAMMAIIGMFFQDGLTGSAWGDWANYTASPLRAAGGDVLVGTGGPFPENYWDPAGLSKGKSEEEMLELRAMELKHGRTAMLACLGWFHVASGVHYIGDFANGEKVSDDPLINLTQLSMGGAMQVVFTIMCTEWLFTYVTPPPKDKPWDLLGWHSVIADEEYPEWKKVQMQELNNGRLAMVAIVGLIAQDLYLGEYGLSQAVCGGNPICYDVGEWQNSFPPSAYESIIYPRG